MRLLTTNILIFVLLVYGRVAAQDVGQTVVVIRAAEMTLDSNPVGTLGEGTVVEVKQVQGDLLWPDLPPESGMKVGWIARRDVLDIDQAIEHYNAAIRRDPSNSIAYRSRALIWQHQGKLDKVLLDLDEAIRLNPRDAYLYEMRGNSRLNLLVQKADSQTMPKIQPELARCVSDFAEALRLFQRDDYGTQKNFFAARASSKLGLLRLIGGDASQAVDDFSLAIRLNPSWPFAYYGRGLAYEELAYTSLSDVEQRRIEQANADFEKAQQRYPEVVKDPFFKPYFSLVAPP